MAYSAFRRQAGRASLGITSPSAEFEGSSPPGGHSLSKMGNACSCRTKSYGGGPRIPPVAGAVPGTARDAYRAVERYSIRAHGTRVVDSAGARYCTFRCGVLEPLLALLVRGQATLQDAGDNERAFDGKGPLCRS